MQTLQDYIFDILKYFATKLHNFTKFRKLFPTVLKLLSNIIVYKEMFLGCDWLIRVQLIPNITQNSAKICNNSAKICNKLFERWDLLAEKPKIWRPNFQVCLKILSKFQHNLGFFSGNYDHKTNSKVCWNFVHKTFSHGFCKHDFFKRRNSRMSALA